MSGYSAIALYRPKTGTNVGTAFRSAQAFGVSLVEVVGSRVPKQSSDTTKAWRSIPHVRTDEIAIPHDCIPVAVEVCAGSVPLPEYRHPKRAIYIFGPEDGSLPADVLARCRDRVTIPGTHCLNLATAVSIVLYDRVAKSGGFVSPHVKEAA